MVVKCCFKNPPHLSGGGSGQIGGSSNCRGKAGSSRVVATGATKKSGDQHGAVSRGFFFWGVAMKWMMNGCNLSKPLLKIYEKNFFSLREVLVRPKWMPMRRRLPTILMQDPRCRREQGRANSVNELFHLNASNKPKQNAARSCCGQQAIALDRKRFFGGICPKLSCLA